MLEKASSGCRSGLVEAETVALEATWSRSRGSVRPPLDTMPCLSQSDGLGHLAEGGGLIPSAAPLAQRRKKVSQEQILAQVAAENQQEKMVPFPAWTAETGQRGGRVLGVSETLAEDTDINLNLTPEPWPAEKAASLQAWMEKSESSPFLVHPLAPALMLHLVRAVLERDNDWLAQEHVQACFDSPF